ncbi:MAG: malonate decarboxylase holo-[acyl-carrier-protein] synthase [Pseudomonadota bacterium]
MPPLRRHQLAIPADAGWQDILARDWEPPVRAGLDHWARQRLPLVVTRQRVPRTSPAAPIALGLCLPERWGRRLVSLQLRPDQLAMFAEFPTLAEVLPQLAPAARPALQQAAAALGARGLRARVYGSLGWQAVTGLRYVHPRSDLDLWLAVDSDSEADAAAALLQRCAPAGLRIDGELVFTDGSATAWREWRAWRAGQCRSLLVKHLDGASLQQRPARMQAEAAAAASVTAA